MDGSLREILHLRGFSLSKMLSVQQDMLQGDWFTTVDLEDVGFQQQNHLVSSPQVQWFTSLSTYSQLHGQSSETLTSGLHLFGRVTAGGRAGCSLQTLSKVLTNIQYMFSVKTTSHCFYCKPHMYLFIYSCNLQALYLPSPIG